MIFRLDLDRYQTSLRRAAFSHSPEHPITSNLISYIGENLVDILVGGRALSWRCMDRIPRNEVGIVVHREAYGMIADEIIEVPQGESTFGHE